jgi:protein-tyrosine phosphatase
VIDTHCHLLPELDDGTRSLDEALDLAAELVSAGVTEVVCTPHRSRRFPTDPVVARERLTQTQAALQRATVDLALHLSAELSPAVALSLGVPALHELAVGGRYVVVELEPGTPASAVGTIFERLHNCELVPIFAHPERSRSVMHDVGELVAVREAGALVQVVASSLAGAWGRSVERGAVSLVKAGRVDLLGSDAHRPGGTSRRLRNVLSMLTERLGRDAVHRLTIDVPRAVLAGSKPV